MIWGNRKCAATSYEPINWIGKSDLSAQESVLKLNTVVILPSKKQRHVLYCARALSTLLIATFQLNELS